MHRKVNIVIGDPASEITLAAALMPKQESFAVLFQALVKDPELMRQVESLKQDKFPYSELVAFLRALVDSGLDVMEIKPLPITVETENGTTEVSPV